MVDIELDGPNPGDYSMICFGAVLVEPALSKTFYGQLRPISDRWIPEALAVSGFTREQTWISRSQRASCASSGMAQGARVRPTHVHLRQQRLRLACQAEQRFKLLKRLYVIDSPSRQTGWICRCCRGPQAQ